MVAVIRSHVLQGDYGYCLQQLALRGFNWKHVINMFVIHAGTVAALWFFTWQALAIAFVLLVVFGMFGITIGYHRLLSHGSFKTYPVVRNVLALFAQLALSGPAAWWVMIHHDHHRFTDTDKDPHTPVRSFWWGHMFCWFQKRDIALEWEKIEKNSNGLHKSPFMLFQFVLEPAIVPVQLAILFALGWLWDGPGMAMSLMLWAGAVRLCVGAHLNWFVNSIAHSHNTEGQPYEHLVQPSNLSRNVFWVGLTTFGEGFHRNHHAKPRQVNHGEGWQKVFDLSYGIIVLMEKCGLAWDLQREKTLKIAKTQAA